MNDLPRDNYLLIHHDYNRTMRGDENGPYFQLQNHSLFPQKRKKTF